MKLDNKKTPASKKLTPPQWELYSSLKKLLGLAPATFYYDACKIVDESCELKSKLNLVSHLLREITGEITNKLSSPNYENKIQKSRQVAQLPFQINRDQYKIKVIDISPTLEDKIDLIAKEFKISKDNSFIKFWKNSLSGEKSGLHKLTHRSSSQGLRKLDNFEVFWNDVERLIRFQTDLLKKKVDTHYKFLDKLLKQPVLSNKNIDDIVTFIPQHYNTLKYFFSQSNHYSSIDYFRKKHFFDYPTLPEEQPDGNIHFLDWPQAEFLKGASKIEKHQDVVIEICLSVDTDNYNVQHPIVELMADLPADKIANFKEVAKNWMNTQQYWVDYKAYGKLISHYAENHLCEEAIDLIDTFLQVRPDPRDSVEVDGYKFGHDPIGIVDEHNYQSFLKEYVPIVINSCGENALTPMVTILEDYLRIENEQKGYKKDDYSDIWRPSIDKTPKHGINNHLVTCIRDNSLSLLEKNPEKLTSIIEMLDKSKLNVIRRLKLYLLSRLDLKNPDKKTKALIRKELINKKEYGDRASFSYEQYIFSKKYAPLLTKSQKEKLWRYIQQPPESDRDGFQEYWQSSRLKPFLGFGDQWKNLYEKNIKISGEPKYLNEESKVYVRRVEDKSPISIEKLKEMNPSEVLDFIIDWKPTDNDPLERTLDGMTIALSATIEKDPSEWLKVIQQIGDLDKAYVRSYFDGFLKAHKSGKSFDWTDLLKFAKEILQNHPAEKDINDGSKIGFDPNWSWCRRTIADLVLQGLKDNENKIPISNREDVWEVIEILLQDPDPDEKRTKSVEQEHLERSRDYLTTAINSIRGVAIEAAIEYGIWLKIRLSEKEQKKWRLDSQAPELSEALINHLDLKKDDSPAIRAIYGQQLMRLTWLDDKWMLSNKDKLFIKEDENKKYFDAAWESYVCYVDPRKQMLDIYEDEYRRAIEELGSRSDASHHLVSPDQRLVQHLSFLYIWGFLDFDTDSIWDDFYSNSPVEARAEVINFLGRSLSGWKDMKPEINKKLVDAVERRLQFVKSLPQSKREPQEFESLSHWFASDLFPIDWRFKVMIEAIDLGCVFEGVHLIVETLSETVNRHPLESVKICKHVTDNDKNGWEIISWRDYLFTILDTAMESGNEDVKKLAIETIRNLMSNGYLHFKELLDKHNV